MTPHSDIPATSKPSHPLGWRVGVLLFLAATGLYLATAQRGISWQDSGEYQWRCQTGDYLQSVPAARTHPLYLFVGQTLHDLVPNEAYPFALNAFSGVMMALALAILAAAMVRLGVTRPLAASVCLTLALCHAIWWLSTIAEVYTTSTALLALELYALIRLRQQPQLRWLVLLAFANGLHLSVHNVALLTLPIYLVAMVAFLRTPGQGVRQIPAAIVAYLVGAGPWIAMLALQINKLGFVAGWTDCLVGHYGEQVMNVAETSAYSTTNLALLALSFASALLPLGVLGACVALRKSTRPIGGYLLAVFLAECLFLIRYNVPDQFTFALPTLVTFALLAALGGQWLAQRSPRWKTVTLAGLLGFALLQPPLFALAYRMTRHQASRPTHSAPRDEGRYWLLPWKQNESSAVRWAHQVEATLPAGAVVFTDTTTYTTLLLQGGPLRVQLGRPKGETLSCLRTTPIYTTLRFGVPRHWAQAEALPTLRLIHIIPETSPLRNATHKSPSPSPPPR